MIQNKHQLKSEIRRLELRSRQQEDVIHQDIKSFKRKLSISGILISIISGIAAAGIGGKVMASNVKGTIFHQGIASGISIMLRKYFAIAEQKVEEFAIQIINKIMDSVRESEVSKDLNDIESQQDSEKFHKDEEKEQST